MHTLKCQKQENFCRRWGYEADEVQSFRECKVIKKVLKPYVDTAKSGDGALARTVFFDHAYVIGFVDGDHRDMDTGTFAGAVSEGGPAPDIQHHVAWISVSGPVR